MCFTHLSGSFRLIPFICLASENAPAAMSQLNQAKKNKQTKETTHAGFETLLTNPVKAPFPPQHRIDGEPLVVNTNQQTRHTHTHAHTHSHKHTHTLTTPLSSPRFSGINIMFTRIRQKHLQKICK